MADRFVTFLQDAMFEIKVVDAEVSMEAAKIRGTYPYFKALDALQLASAIVAGADIFYTNDKQLLQFKHNHLIVSGM